MMRLAGFYDIPIRLTMEDVVGITIEDEDKVIKGRMDILAVNQAEATIAPPFWVLVIETKNSEIDVFEGLPQLLTYAFKSLEQQSSVWGLVTRRLIKVLITTSYLKISLISYYKHRINL
ncbi:hypothetical protein VB797_29520 [Rivularia sp. UHCC 0363]|nr:hypothetical protein [Rivularia sp. UHCC 0363]MEA5598481.1 hypothetical protein [Rivularia sp. UHCC 0363]